MSIGQCRGPGNRRFPVPVETPLLVPGREPRLGRGGGGTGEAVRPRGLFVLVGGPVGFLDHFSRPDAADPRCRPAVWTKPAIPVTFRHFLDHFSTTAPP